MSGVQILNNTFTFDGLSDNKLPKQSGCIVWKFVLLTKFGQIVTNMKHSLLPSCPILSKKVVRKCCSKFRKRSNLPDEWSDEENNELFFCSNLIRMTYLTVFCVIFNDTDLSVTRSRSDCCCGCCRCCFLAW